MFADYPFVDLCNVTRVLEVRNITRPLFPITWRFLPLMDPTVDRMLPRDSDSLITAREVEAVREWLTDSNATFHLMRDHWGHCSTEILGGIITMLGNDIFVLLFFFNNNHNRVLGCKTVSESTSHFRRISQNLLPNGTQDAVRIRSDDAQHLHLASSYQ